jgi:hypothetical protein
MTATLVMVTRRGFGLQGKAHLNRGLMDALRASGELCERCREIQKGIDAIPEGGDFVEAPSFPGMTVQSLDVHFRFHWKSAYELTAIPTR